MQRAPLVDGLLSRLNGNNRELPHSQRRPVEWVAVSSGVEVLQSSCEALQSKISK